MKRSVRVVETPQVAVATLDAKAYYTLTSLLKEMNLTFSSITPGESLDLGVRLVLTTRREKSLIQSGIILCLEELIGDFAAAKEKIFSVLYHSGDDVLIIGIDPGERTGIAAYYREKEMIEDITRSPKETYTKIEALIRASAASRKIVRIGDGNPHTAREIADRLLQHFDDKIEVEIVDERGTSTTTNLLRTRESRDLRSARMISFRRGRRYQTA